MLAASDALIVVHSMYNGCVATCFGSQSQLQEPTFTSGE